MDGHLKNLLKAADQCLYKSKSAGRDTVTLATRGNRAHDLADTFNELILYFHGMPSDMAMVFLYCRAFAIASSSFTVSSFRSRITMCPADHDGLHIAALERVGQLRVDVVHRHGVGFVQADQDEVGFLSRLQ